MYIPTEPDNMNVIVLIAVLKKMFPTSWLYVTQDAVRRVE